MRHWWMVVCHEEDVVMGARFELKRWRPSWWGCNKIRGFVVGLMLIVEGAVVVAVIAVVVVATDAMAKGV
jgi:hypothetical protein